MIKGCVAWTTLKAVMPWMRARSMETFPSSFPGIRLERIQLMLRSPVMMPSSKSTAPSWRGMLVAGSVPSCRPAGPLIFWYSPKPPSLSTTSLPWLGGLSMTTRPRFCRGQLACM